MPRFPFEDGDSTRTGRPKEDAVRLCVTPPGGGGGKNAVVALFLTEDHLPVCHPLDERMNESSHPQFFFALIWIKIWSVYTVVQAAE